MRERSKFLRFRVATLVALLGFLSGCTSTQEKQPDSTFQDVQLCPQIRSAKAPEHHLALTKYRDGLVMPTMVTSMSSDEAIGQIRKVCPSPLNVSDLAISLFREDFVRSGNRFFRQQEYQLTSPWYYSVHGGCVTSILVWFNPDGSIQGMYNGGWMCAV